ncbi:hypothetical protein [Burkholderia ubonensis]|nr:hypothetical protein [Burkholderia ubonensis]KWK86097.1 hypothetical protein WM17_08000 [Burkholderia ubonensis]
MTIVRATPPSDLVKASAQDVNSYARAPVEGLPQAGLKFSIERFNDLVASAVADPLQQVEIANDWRTYVQSRFTLEKEQSRFLWSLPEKSVDTVQRVIASAIEDGGRLYLRRMSDSQDIEVVCDEIGLFKGALNVLVCRFDGIFRNCKWFPKK